MPIELAKSRPAVQVVPPSWPDNDSSCRHDLSGHIFVRGCQVSFASASAAGGEKPDLVLPRTARLPVPARPHAAAATPHHLSKKLPRRSPILRAFDEGTTASRCLSDGGSRAKGAGRSPVHLRRRQPPSALLLAHRAPDTRGRWLGGPSVLSSSRHGRPV